MNRQDEPQTPLHPQDQPDYLALLDHHLQEAFTHLNHLSSLIDEADDYKTFYRLFDAYSRNAVRLSRLVLDRQALAPPEDTFETLLGQALDEIAADLGLEL